MIRYADCRAVGLGELRENWSRLATDCANGGGVALTAWQVAGLGALVTNVPAERMLVTVPDFLHYGRLVNTGQAKSIAELPGNLGSVGLAGLKAGFSLAKRPLQAAQMDFWHFAEVLLHYDLGLLPSRYRGCVLLHSHLMDFACVFGRQAFLERYFSSVGGNRAVGVHTQQVPAALSALAQWGLQPSVLSYLAAPGDVAGERALQAATQAATLRGSKLIAEVESWPADLQGPLGLARFSGWKADALLTAFRG